MKREWLLEEDALALLLPLAGSRLLRQWTGRSKNAVIGRYHRLSRGLKGPRPKKKTKPCERCGGALKRVHRRFCSLHCRRTVMQPGRDLDNPGYRAGRTLTHQEYNAWYRKLPEAVEARRRRDRGRYRAGKRGADCGVGA